jgi:hypothetical protein
VCFFLDGAVFFSGNIELRLKGGGPLEDRLKWRRWQWLGCQLEAFKDPLVGRLARPNLYTDGAFG